jgi:hypothetical protein
MRLLAILAIILCPLLLLAQAPVIGPSPAVINQGGFIGFLAISGSPVTWSNTGSGTLSGSTTVATTYTAPASVTPHQSMGGCQLLPNNHIINTNISGYPIDSNSATWMGQSPFSSENVGFEFNVPFNIINSLNTTSKNLAFQYTPLNDGPFIFAGPPYGRSEAGWYGTSGGSFFNLDHHNWHVNPSTCQFTELYQYYPAGFSCSSGTCTATTGDSFLQYTYNLPVNGSTSAGGMQDSALEVHRDEWINCVNNSVPIAHALRITMNSGVLVNTTFRWPAQGGYTIGSGLIPLGTRFRLKSAFNISGYSAPAQCLLTALKNYGAFTDDGTFGGPVITLDDADLPYAYQQAIYPELTQTSQIPMSNFEIVDESAQEVSASSGLTTSNVENVCATNGSGTTCVPVVLLGPTIQAAVAPAGIDHMDILAGTPAQQLQIYINDNASWSSTYSCTMSPTVGTLSGTGNCTYTPPTSVAAATGTIITATSSAIPTATSTIAVTVYPVISNLTRILLSGPCQTGVTPSIQLTIGGCATTYTDDSSNVWQGQADFTQNDNCGSSSIPPWPNQPNVRLYMIPGTSLAGGDTLFGMIVPNGTYSNVLKFGVGPCGYNNTPGQAIMNIEVNGTTYFSNFDIAAAAGTYTPIDKAVNNVTVTNNYLFIALRKITGFGPVMSAFQFGFSPASPNTGVPRYGMLPMGKVPYYGH